MTVNTWSTTAATNSTADATINWAEGQAPSSVNNSARAMMAAVAKLDKDLSAGKATTGGTTAYLLTTNQVFASLAAAENYAIGFTPNATNTGTTTINVDGLGAKPLRSAPGVELQSDDLKSGVPYTATYFTTNSGEWILHGPALNGVPTTALLKALSADDTGGQNVNTAQPWFPTAGAVTLSANKTYRFRGRLRLSRAAGTTGHNTTIKFGGTATVSSIEGYTTANANDAIGTNSNPDYNTFNSASGCIGKGTSTSATEQAGIYVDGIMRIGTGGTFIPQFQYSAAPGGAPTVKANTFFELFEIGTDTVTTRGTWA
jgi:hypothetical protein